jgi:putative spermidine/putrescine transport system permease protein
MTTSRARSVLVLPALLPTALVLATGLATATAQSLGLIPLVGDPRVSLDGYRAAVGNGVGDAALVSLLVATTSTAAAVVVGFTIAVLVQRSAVGGRLLRSLAALTVPVPHIVGAAAVGLLLADSGMVARVLGVEPNAFPPIVAGPWWLAVIAEYAWKESAFVALVVVAALARDERALDEAAATLGAGSRQRLRRVTLPRGAPPRAASGGIAFTYVLGSYEVPWLLGRTSPEPLPVLAYRLFTDVDLATRPQALAVALLTVALSTVAVAATVALVRATAVLR